MIDDTPIEPETNSQPGPVGPLWLSVGALIGLLLFVLAPMVSDDSRVSQGIVEESAALADALIEEGLAGVREQATSGSPVGFLTRWTATAALLLNPTEDDGSWIRALACFLWALSWWGLSRFVAGPEVRVRSPEPWLLLGLLLLSGPGRAGASGEIAGAVMFTAGVGFALACQHLARGPRSAWSLGVIWGAAALLHPALLALGVPIFIFAARAYREQEPDPGALLGHGPLPHVPLSVLASPIVAAMVLLGLWTLVGGEVRDLISSIDQLWRHPGSQRGGASLGPSPGVAIGAGLASLGWLATILATIGSLLPGEAGERRIAWFVLATIFIAGGLDGRLHDPAASLMIFSLPFVTALGLQGPLELWRRARS